MYTKFLTDTEKLVVISGEWEGEGQDGERD